MRPFPLRAFAALSVLALFTACSSTEVHTGQSVSLSVALTGDACGVTSAMATVTGADIETIGPIPLTVTQSEITGEITSVPAGLSRTVLVSAYNASDLLVYQGSAVVNVQAGQQTTAQLSLSRVHENCPTSGSIIIVGTIETGSNDGGVSTDGGSADVGDGGIILSGPGLNFTFVDSALTTDGVLHFLDQDTDRIHRLDLTTRALLPALIGTLEAQSMAVDPDGTEAYLGYVGGRIDSFDLVNGTTAFFGAAPETISSMIVAGSRLFTIDSSGAWDSHAVYDRANGTRLSSEEWRSSSRSTVYSPLLERIFLLDSGSSPTDVAMVELTGGVLGAETDSPYHGDYSLPNPLRLLPDESGVIVGSGIIFNTADLTYRTSLGLPFVDIAFLNGNLHLVDADGQSARLRKLDSTFSIVETESHPGTPRRLFAWNGQLVLVTTAASGGVEIRLLQP